MSYLNSCVECTPVEYLAVDVRSGAPVEYLEAFGRRKFGLVNVSSALLRARKRTRNEFEM